jgi:hypothetical protein
MICSCFLARFGPSIVAKEHVRQITGLENNIGILLSSRPPFTTVSVSSLFTLWAPFYSILPTIFTSGSFSWSFILLHGRYRDPLFFFFSLSSCVLPLRDQPSEGIKTTFWALMTSRHALGLLLLRTLLTLLPFSSPLPPSPSLSPDFSATLPCPI